MLTDIYISFCRCKHLIIVFLQLCGLLAKLPSLKLWSGMKCARGMHGHLVISFTVRNSFVRHTRVSELHHITCSLADALLTSSPLCASV